MGQGAAVVPSSSFVGRARELGRLAMAAEAARAGRGSMMVVVGEAGIGKTRLAEEAAASAAALGSEVLWASCREAGGAPAYFPWGELLRAHADVVGFDAMASDVGEWADVVSTLLPRRALSGPAMPLVAARPDRLDEGLDPDGTRFRLFEAVADVLGRAAARAPLVLVFDDLQWADVPSLLLLRFVVRDVSRRRVVVIGTYRGPGVDWDGERGRLLSGLGSPGGALHLGELDAHEVAELVATLTGGLPPDDLTAAVRERAGGNPLFVLELASLPSELWNAQTGLGVSGSSIPQRLRAVLEHRAASLSHQCRDVLEVAAVVGNEFKLEVLARVLAQPEQAVLGALEEAAAGWLVVAPQPPTGRWRFRHGLVRDLGYGRLSPERRRALHRVVAETLEAAGDGEGHVAALAHHFLRASTRGDTARAVHYCEAAGRQATHALAYEEAAEHFDRALVILGEERSADPRRVELLLLTGDARMRAGDLPAARAAFVAAAEEARSRGRTEGLARAALGFGAGLAGFEVRLFDRVQLDLLEEALAALGTEDSSLRAWVLARLSVALSFVESSERRQALSEEAVTVARRVGDDAALAHALASRCDAVAGPVHAEDRLEDATEIVRLARAVGDRGLELLGHRLRVVAALELGDMAAVDAQIEDFARTAASVRQPLYQWYVPLWRAMRAVMDGRLDDAERHNAAAGEIGGRVQSENAVVAVAGQRFVFACERGDLADAERRLRAMSDEGLPLGYGPRAWMASVVARQGRRSEARAIVERLVAEDLAELPEEDAEWLAALCQLAQACAAVGAPEAAGTLYRRLLPHRGRFAVDGIADGCLGSVERYLGLLAAARRRYGDAEKHFAAALAANRAAGSPLLAAHVLSDHGAVLAALDPLDRNAGDDERAASLLREAAEAYRDLGLDRWITVIQRHIAATETPPPSPPAAAINVFQRTGTVWTLAFAGAAVHLPDAKGLRDIARLLGRTGVEVHVLDLVDSKVSEGDTGVALDARARDEYRARLVELEADLEEAEAGNDLARVEAIAEERDFLLREISAAFGLGGRARRGGDAAERARAAVAWRIRDSLKKIEALHPALARHLRNSIRTGVFCSYEPEQPIDWSL
ncbi:MAG: ATP-binding protein [Acidimicrobiales bacterium]